MKKILTPLLLPLLILADEKRHDSEKKPMDAVNPGFITEPIIPTPECTLDDSARFFKVGSSIEDPKYTVYFKYEVVMEKGSSEDLALVLGRVESKVVKLVLPSLFDACPSPTVPDNRKRRIQMDSNSVDKNLAGLSSFPEDVVLENEVCIVNEDSEGICTPIEGGITFYTNLTDEESVAILQSKIEESVKESLISSDTTWTDVSEDIVSVSWVDQDDQDENIIGKAETLKIADKSNGSILAATLVPVGVAAIALFAFLKHKNKPQSSFDMTNRDVDSLGNDDEDVFEVDSWKANSFVNNFKSGVVQFNMDESGNIESSLEQV